jgi:hypothetical protein
VSGALWAPSAPRDLVEKPHLQRRVERLRLQRRAGGADASRSAARAKELLTQFERDYPNSMRTAAVPVLRDALR